MELTHEQAIELALKTRWKTSVCNQGESCWCRIVEPETKIQDSEGEEVYIVGSGSVPKAYAEHIVKLHNDSLEKSCLNDEPLVISLVSHNSQLAKPTPEQYGYQPHDLCGEPAGWAIEGGEEAYYKALRKWDSENNIND